MPGSYGTLVFLFFSSQSYCTAIYTTLPNISDRLKVVALIKDKHQIKPVIYKWSPPGLSLPALARKKEIISSEIPTILLGEETGIESLTKCNLLHIAGADVNVDLGDCPIQIKINEEGVMVPVESYWLKSRWLGWVYAKEYPNLYLPDEGWIYVDEIEEGEFWIYNFTNKTWNYRNLDEEYNPFQTIVDTGTLNSD